MNNAHIDIIATEISAFFGNYSSEEINEKLLNIYRGWVYGLYDSAAIFESKGMLVFYEELREVLKTLSETDSKPYVGNVINMKVAEIFPKRPSIAIDNTLGVNWK